MLPTNPLPSPPLSLPTPSTSPPLSLEVSHQPSLSNHSCCPHPLLWCGASRPSCWKESGARNGSFGAVGRLFLAIIVTQKSFFFITLICAIKNLKFLTSKSFFYSIHNSTIFQSSSKNYSMTHLIPKLLSRCRDTCWNFKCEWWSPTSIKNELNEEYIIWRTHRLIVLRFWVKMWRPTCIINSYLVHWFRSFRILGSHPNKWYQTQWFGIPCVKSFLDNVEVRRRASANGGVYRVGPHTWGGRMLKFQVRVMKSHIS